MFEYFRKTVAEGAGKPDFPGDTPELDLGSMELTEAGMEIASVLAGMSTIATNRK